MKKRLQKANAGNASHVVFVDVERWGRGELEIKNLVSGEQQLVSGNQDMQIDAIDELSQIMIADRFNAPKEAIEMDSKGGFGFIGNERNAGES